MEIASHLKILGLSDAEIAVFTYLSGHPFQRASTITHHTNIGRTHVYYALEKLTEAGLVTKHDTPGKPARYSIVNPSRSFSDIQKTVTDQAKQKTAAITELIGSLQNNYNYLSGQPNVKFYEGLDGLQRLYDDILRQGQDILLMRSYLDHKIPEIKPIVLRQIREQVKRGINTRALVPYYDGPNRDDRKEHDTQNLITRKELPENTFHLPAQVIIYGNKVGVSTFSDHPTTTIIENPVIAANFRVVFEILWEV